MPARLKALNDSYLKVIDQSPLSTQVLAPDGTTIMVNKAWEQMWGATIDDLKGYNMLKDQQLIKAGLMPYIQKGFEGQPTVIPEIKYKTGETIRDFKGVPFVWVKAFIYPLRDKEDKIQAVVLVHENITDRKIVEKQKDDFLAIASHELKTPITTLKAYTQILQQVFSENPKANLYLDKMSEQLNRLITLVNELLDVSRIESGKLRLNKEKFLLDDLLRDVTADLAHINKQHRIIVEGVTTTFVYADKYRISQVLINLISNAIKYSPKSDRVIVSLKEHPSEVVVKIKDFGIGITKRDIALVFSKFFQANNKIRQSFAGLGLGLHISSEIIERHHGKIWVESTKGVGSTFYFSLPLSKRFTKNKILVTKGGIQDNFATSA